MSNKPTDFKKGDLVKYCGEAAVILKSKGNLGIIIKKPAKFYQVGYPTKTLSISPFKVYFFAAKQAYWLYIDELKKLSK